ncbi:MAG: GAF domain-containing protein [Desulfobulbaceae bacterium]|nr:MAG: GAF domain-containing protein [Desulfobulbaceae bacterium]
MGRQGKDGYIQIFQQVTRMISMVHDPRQVMEIIVHSLPELLAIDACTIRLLDQASGSFVLGAAAGLSPEYLGRPDVDSRETLGMVASGHPVAMSEVANSPHLSFREAALKEGIESVLTLPIAFQERVIGIMRLLTRNRRSFAEAEIAFAMALAEQVGIAIANGRMFKQLAQQVEFLRELQFISQLVNSTLDLDRVLTTIVELLPRSLQAQGCTIRLLTPKSKELELAASAGLSREYLDRGEVVDEKNTIRALRGEAVAIQDVTADDRVLYHEHMVREGIRSLLAVPIKVMDEVIGIIRILAREPRQFSEAEINFSLAVAEAGGSAITNARTYRKITLLFNQIEEHEHFLANIIDCIRPQLIVIDRQGRVVMANRAFLEASGWQEGEVLGMEYRRLCRSEEGREMCPVDQVLTSGRMASSIHRLDGGDGPRWLERTATPMIDESGEVEFVIEVIRDLTAQRLLEAEQVERSKLEGVVEMAGAVAHEINTPLFAALGTAQILEADLAGTAEEEDIRTVIRNLKSISELTAKMTAMTGYSSRDYVGETRIVSL